MALSKLSVSLREKINPFGIETDSCPATRCISCRTKERLLSFKKLRGGDHICMGGKLFMFGIGGKQIAAYTHHAIVKSVQIESNAAARVTLIHFYTTSHDTSIRIQETSEIMDLHYHEINIIRYRYPTHQREKIIERAEQLLSKNQKTKYSVFSCNCEHICNWCCVGNAKSFQAESAKDALNGILAGIVNVGGKTLGVVCKLLFVSLEDISKIASSCLINVPWGTLAVIAIIYLLYVVYQNFKLDDERKKGHICFACAHRKKVNIWLQFTAYCGLQVGGLGLLSLVITAGASYGVVIGSLIACGVLSVVCIANAPKFRKLFVAPFRGRSRKIKSMRDIWIGDVISLNQCGMRHASVVSAVKMFPETDYRRGLIKIIHYSRQSIFDARKIVEEEKALDLDHDTVFGHDYSGYTVHDPETVVYRARQRVGETKFNLTSNRSCHFCHWAKIDERPKDECTNEDEYVKRTGMYLKEVDPRETISNLPDHSVHIDHRRGRKLASKTIGKVCVRIRDEVKSGQLIEYKYKGLAHTAVTTDVQFDSKKPSKILLTIVHYGKDRKIKEETIEFDLNREDIWIHKYHPLYCYSRQQIVRRARARLNPGTNNIMRHQPSYFLREVVEKGITVFVTDLGDIKPGDVISFRSRLFLNEAVVTNVTTKGSKQKSSGHLSIMHYAFENIASRRTIIEETISIDLQKEKICLLKYEGYITYPREKVIERARSRLDEQRYSICCGNTSAAFAHWAKVVQNPTEMGSANAESNSHLLIPKAGTYKDGFQRFSVWTWTELFPGIIVEYRENVCKSQGIVSYVDEEEQLIKLIQYSSEGIVQGKTVREINVKLNLRRDDVWTYRAHPRRCYKSSVVLANALRLIGQKKTKFRNNSWDFCKECMLKHSSDLFK